MNRCWYEKKSGIGAEKVHKCVEIDSFDNSECK